MSAPAGVAGGAQLNRALCRSTEAAWIPEPESDNENTILTPAGELRDLQARLATRYPVARFASARRALDPNNILSNRLVDSLLPRDA